MSAPMNKRVSIFEIAEEFRALEDLLENDGQGVTEHEHETIAKWLDELDMKLEDKVEGYIAIVRNNELLQAGLKEEAKRLNDRAKIHGNKVDRLKSALMYVMEQLGLPRIETKRGTVSVAGNGGVLPMTVMATIEQMPERFTKRVIDEAAIRLALEAGDEEAAKVAELGARGQHLRIK